MAIGHQAQRSLLTAYHLLDCLVLNLSFCKTHHWRSRHLRKHDNMTPPHELHEDGVVISNTATTTPATTTTCRHTCSRPAKRSVRFDKIEIIEYPFVLGDHPSVSSGVPLTIDWDPQSSLTMDFELYHKDKPPSRTLFEMRMDHGTRMRILQSSGWTHSQIFDAIQSVETDKALRRQNYPTNISCSRTVRRKLMTPFQRIGSRSFGSKKDVANYYCARGRRQSSS